MIVQRHHGAEVHLLHQEQLTRATTQKFKFEADVPPRAAFESSSRSVHIRDPFLLVDLSPFNPVTTS